MDDVRRKYPQMLSDFKDGLHPQALGVSLFVYFACLSATVTFGAMMGNATDQYMVSMKTVKRRCKCYSTLLFPTLEQSEAPGSLWRLLCFIYEVSNMIVFAIPRTVMTEKSH